MAWLACATLRDERARHLAPSCTADHTSNRGATHANFANNRAKPCLSASPDVPPVQRRHPICALVRGIVTERGKAATRADRHNRSNKRKIFASLGIGAGDHAALHSDSRSYLASGTLKGAALEQLRIYTKGVGSRET